MKLKIGDKVVHINHGNGIVTGFTGDSSSAIVKFEKEVWGTDELEVSVACLKLVE